MVTVESEGGAELVGCLGRSGWWGHEEENEVTHKPPPRAAITVRGLVYFLSNCFWFIVEHDDVQMHVCQTQT